MLACILIIAFALAFVGFLLLGEILFDFLYQFSPRFRRWYRDFYKHCRG